MTRNTKLLVAGMMCALLAGTQGGCAGPARVAGEKASPGQTGSENKILTGKVVETMDAGGYTYICLEKDSKKTWVAVPAMKVKVGDELQLNPGAVMPGFTSTTLNRTFDEVIFSSGPVTDNTGQPATPATKGMSAQPGKTAKPEPPVLAGKVVETMDAAGYTYICLEKDGKRGWSAVTTTPVKVGDEIEILPGVEMGQFSSKTLNRTFDNIYFSRGIKAAGTAPPAQQLNQQPATPAGHPPLPGKDAGKPGMDAKPAADMPKLTGTVVETMDAAGYTYICLEKDGKKTWAAVPTTKVTVGDQLELVPGAEMKQFQSKALNRTFDSIIFSSGLVPKK